MDYLDHFAWSKLPLSKVKVSTFGSSKCNDHWWGHFLAIQMIKLFLLENCGKLFVLRSLKQSCCVIHGLISDQYGMMEAMVFQGRRNQELRLLPFPPLLLPLPSFIWEGWEEGVLSGPLRCSCFPTTKWASFPKFWVPSDFFLPREICPGVCG